MRSFGYFKTILDNYISDVFYGSFYIFVVLYFKYIYWNKVKCLRCYVIHNISIFEVSLLRWVVMALVPPIVVPGHDFSANIHSVHILFLWGSKVFIHKSLAIMRYFSGSSEYDYLYSGSLPSPDISEPVQSHPSH